MALAEVLSPLSENKGFRPHVVAPVAEQTLISDLTPPEDLDVFVDEYVARMWRTAILDETIKLPASGRSMSENLNAWSEDDLVQYGMWLCKLIDINPDGSGDKSLTGDHIARASKLNIGPSYIVFENVFQKNPITSLKIAMGDKSPKLKFTDKSDIWCVTEGMELAERCGGRPKGRDMDAAREEGLFPGQQAIIERFGSLKAFHEYIGYPSLKDAEEEVFLLLGAAFKRQNGPDTPLNTATINALSRRGRGPSRRGVQETFTTFAEYDRRATEKYWEQMAEDRLIATKQATMISELRKRDALFEEATDLLSGEELRRIWGGYELVTQLVPDIDRAEAAELAASRTPYELVDRISAFRPDMKLADIMMWAELLDLSKALWPYRFHNADLRVENAAGGQMPEIIPLASPAQAESATGSAPTKLEIRRQQRLARLASSGLGIEAPDAAYDVNRFAKHGSKFTPAEMHDLQNVIRRGERKAKRLELFGDDLGPLERQQINQAVRLGNDAKDAFVRENAGLVRLLLMPKFRPKRTPEQLDEILQAGELGVLRALYKFDPDKGFKFGTYAEWWIRREAFTCARRQNYGLTLSQDDDTAVRSAMNRGEFDTDGPTDEALEFLARVKGVTSLNKRLMTNEGSELGDLLADDSATNPEDTAISRTDATRLLEILDDEDELELKLILSQRFGLADGIVRMPKEISAEIGISSDTAAQRVKIALERIRKAHGIAVV